MSERQAKVESSIKTFKRCFKAAQMPGTVPLTIVSFSRCVQNCASLMNMRPIVILPPSLSDPDKLMTVSPSSLCGPSDSYWTSLGAVGDYKGQQALQASLLTQFRKYWKLHYAQHQMSNGQMAKTREIHLKDVVLITDLTDNSGRSNPHAALGRVIGFLDPDTRSQAIVKYHQGTVTRPT